MATCTDTATAPPLGEDATDDWRGEPLSMESLCMNCYKNGTTHMLLTKIPHFRELTVCSFECPHCGNRNNEVQFAGAYGDLGVRYALTVRKGDAQALSRQVVKSDSATVRVPELEFEIPPDTQRGSITTVEGLLREAAALRALQPERIAADPTQGAAVEAFLARLDACAEGEAAFTLLLDDPAGNSYVEASAADAAADPLLSVERYERTREQAAAIGLLPPAEAGQEPSAAGGAALPAAVGAGEIAPGDVHHGAAPVGAAAAHRGLARLEGAGAEALLARYAAPEEVLELPSSCAACGAPCTTRMFRTDIPFFKDVILMSDSCDVCGYKNSELKGGGGVSDHGRRITVHVSEPDDLRRDVIKAETASVLVPELDLEVSTGTLGGLVTTVEGLVQAVQTALRNTQSFHLGDSARADDRSAWQSFFAKLEACAALDAPWTLVLQDPLANSFVSSVVDDPRADPRMTIEDYVRSAEEDEDFGISHLRTHALANDMGSSGLATVGEEVEEDQ